MCTLKGIIIIEAKEIHGDGMKISRDAYKAMCRKSTEENKNRYKRLNNKAKKAVSKAIEECKKWPVKK